MMNDDLLVEVRRRAERAVADMEDGPLKVAAFRVIIGKLLDSVDLAGLTPKAPRVKTSPSKLPSPQTLGDRILLLKSDGFFKVQRSLADAQKELASRGWHYPLTTLSGAMQRLVQRRELRRVQVTDAERQVWKYSEP